MSHTHIHTLHTPRPKSGHFCLKIFTQLSQPNASGQAPWLPDTICCNYTFTKCKHLKRLSSLKLPQTERINWVQGYIPETEADFVVHNFTTNYS